MLATPSFPSWEAIREVRVHHSNWELDQTVRGTNPASDHLTIASRTYAAIGGSGGGGGSSACLWAEL